MTTRSLSAPGGASAGRVGAPKGQARRRNASNVASRAGRMAGRRCVASVERAGQQGKPSERPKRCDFESTCAGRPRRSHTEGGSLHYRGREANPQSRLHRQLQRRDRGYRAGRRSSAEPTARLSTRRPRCTSGRRPCICGTRARSASRQRLDAGNNATLAPCPPMCDTKGWTSRNPPACRRSGRFADARGAVEGAKVGPRSGRRQSSARAPGRGAIRACLRWRCRRGRCPPRPR